MNKLSKQFEEWIRNMKCNSGVWQISFQDYLDFKSKIIDHELNQRLNLK